MIEGIFRLLEGWYSRKGLLVSLIVAFVSEMSFLSSQKVSWWLSVPIITFSLIAIYICWWSSNRPARTPKNKIGFVVCISCAADDEGAKIREDFVIPLRQLIKSGKTGRLFYFIEPPNRISANIIDYDAAQALRIKCKAHFMLWGRVRLRTLNGKENHVIDLNGLVTHKPIPEVIGKAFANEFGELLPSKIVIPQENDLLSFQFTSEWAEVVARYIIGIAAAVSGDFNNAESLYTEALERLSERSSNFPVYNKLKQRIPIRISELYENKARQAYTQWAKTHDPSYMDEVGKHLGRIVPNRMEHLPMPFLRAIYAFVHDEDVDAAIAILEKHKKRSDGLWRYNLAFLFAYKGDLGTAFRHYRKAVLCDIEADALSQIEEFICWVVDRHPDKYQLKYCLGYLNWKVKGDRITAIKDFQDFLYGGNPSEFAKEREIAVKWIKVLSEDKTAIPNVH